jgi:hypothetical protein
MRVSKRSVIRSIAPGLGMAATGILFQVAKSRLFLNKEPPRPEFIAIVAVLYCVLGFCYALGYFLIADRLPGRSPASRGLAYAGLVLAAVGIGGFLGVCALDFDGGWNPWTRFKVENYAIALSDILNFSLWGLILGLATRKEGTRETAAPVSATGVRMRIAVAAILFPVICAGSFFLLSLALPTGYDLSGPRWAPFYAYLFGSLLVSGAGTGLFHQVLRPSPSKGVVRDSLKVSLFLFFLYWSINIVFGLAFGFTWAIIVDLLLTVALSLFAVAAVLEAMAARVSTR